MIYCANCKKPSAKESGACPHCGEDLLGRKQAGPEESSSEPLFGGGEELDLGDSDISGIELASDDYVPPVEGQITGMPPGEVSRRGPEQETVPLEQVEPPKSPPGDARPAQREITPAEIEKTAAFGSPREGVLGAVGYWSTVRKRVKALQAEEELAGRTFRKHEGEYLSTMSALGRRVQDLGLVADRLAPLVARAKEAQGDLVGVEKRRAGLVSEHQESIEAIEKTIGDLEKEMEPVREGARQAREKLDGLRTDKKRAEAKLKRAEIERRNLLEMIASRQESYADLERPEEEREKLLSEISGLDEKQPEIVNRIKVQRAEITAMEGPLAEADDEHGRWASRMKEFNEKLAALKAERRSLDDAFSKADEGVARQLEGEVDQAERAWAAVGDSACFEDGCKERLEDAVDKALVVRGEYTSARRHQELLAAAAESYDSDVFERGKRMLLVAAGVGGALLLVGIILAAI